MKKMELQNNTMLNKNAKINFETFSYIDIINENLEFLHIVSSSISNSHFDNTIFYNASLLSTKFSNVKFKECNLKSTDIGSVWANSCQFFECNFSNATISDSIFINCIFDKSIFESISLSRCTFIDCNFLQFPMDDSTFTLNIFKKCQINNTHLTESFYYQIFDDCSFHNVNMEPVLLGYNFGFSSKVFNQLTDGINLLDIDSDFTNKGLFINAAIFRINQIHKYYDEAMIACIIALGNMLQHDILIKVDEIEFLKNLTTFLQDRNQVTPISILRMWQLLNQYCIKDSYSVASNTAMPHIREYSNMLYFSFIEFQNKLQQKLEQIPQGSCITDTAELKIVYLKQPTLQLLDFLKEFTSMVGVNCPKPVFLHAEKGSFLEFHNIAVAIIPYLQTFFSFLGIIVPIVIYKKQKHDFESKTQGSNVITADTNTKSEIEIVIKEKENDQPLLILPNSNASTPKTNIMVSDMVKIFGAHSMINKTGFCGYNPQNIQSITIQFH